MENRTPAEAVQYYIDHAQEKAGQPALRMLISSVFSGFMIALGSMTACMVSFAMPNYSVMRLVSSLLFPFGLAVILLLSTDLFTSCLLLTMPLIKKKITAWQMLRTLVLVYVGNFLGGGLTAFCMAKFGQYSLDGGKLAVYMINNAAHKCELSFSSALVMGVFCNLLVCLAVFLSFLSKGHSGKILYSFLPICFFVAGGFEHCVANMYYITAGLLAAANPAYYALAEAAGIHMQDLTWANFFVKNLLPVTIGNLLGGAAIALFALFMYGAKKTAQKA